MRAGLLSQPQVIQRINDHFVSTTITYPELARLAEPGDALARAVADHWTSPVNLMFLTPEGRFVSKLTSLTDFTDVHPDTSLRPGQKRDSACDVTNTRVFMKHLDHFLDSS